MTQKDIDRFWEKVDVKSSNECWLWKAGTYNGTRGQFHLGTKCVLAHRVALQIKLGRSIREGYESLHTCDVGLCCNPNHLYEGTQSDNMFDRAERRGRYGGAHQGQDHHCAKLTEEQVVGIVAIYLTDRYTKAEIARMYDVSNTTVYHIVRGESWAHLFTETY